MTSGRSLTCEYRIWITGGYDIPVLSPEMIALLVEKVRGAAARNLVIPVEEIVPQSYGEYLAPVLEANMAGRLPGGMQEVYGLTARQIGALNVEKHRCFDRACLYGQARRARFDLSASEAFYALARQATSNFAYTVTAPMDR